MKKFLILITLLSLVFFLGISTVSATPESNFTVGEITSASVTVKNHIETTKTLPNSVNIGTSTINTAQYLHLAVQTTNQINNNNSTPIPLQNDNIPGYQEEQLNTGSINLASYIDFAQRIDGYMDENHQAPPYGWIGPGKISYTSQVYLYSRILTIYNYSSSLPPQMTVKPWSTQNMPITETQFFNFTPNQIALTANQLKNTIETSKSLPITVTLSGVNVNTAQFLHLAVQATNQINNNNTTPIQLKNDNIPGYQEEQLNTGSINLASYIDFAQRIDGYMDENHQAPPYGWIGPGKISYTSQTYLYSRILGIYCSNGSLPLSLNVKPWSASNIPIIYVPPVTFTPEQIVKASAPLKNIESAKDMPNNVTIGSITMNMAQYLHLVVQATNQVNNNDTTPIWLQDDNMPPYQEEELNYGNLSKSSYLDFAQRINNHLNDNHQAPPYGIIGLGKINYSNMIYTFSRILDYYNSLQTLPESIGIISWTHVLNSVYNNRSSERFRTIQEAINDKETQNGDTIVLGNVSYTENVIINKTLILLSPTENVTINAAKTNQPVITINSNGNSSILMNLIMKGSTSNSGIYIENSFNNTIYQSTINNNLNGIYLNNSTETHILGNTINNNIANGIYIKTGLNNTIYQNIIEYNHQNGISLYNSSSEIHFNRITKNNLYGLYYSGNKTIINATNNWWGSNNPLISSSQGDIFVADGNVTYNPWIVLNITESSPNCGGNTSITADLTHNNRGENTSPQGNLPNGIPVNFTTNFGTIISTSYTLKGKAETILNLGNTQPTNVNIFLSLDHQNVSKMVAITTGTLILNINSTALDCNTGQKLNINYSLPLNSSVSWVSLLWKNIDFYQDEVYLIINGNVVINRTVINQAYSNFRNYYSLEIFNKINFINEVFSNSEETILLLDDLKNKNPHLQNLTGNQLEDGIIELIRQENNFTDIETNFIKNNYQQFIDPIEFYMSYPGDNPLNLNHTNYHTNETMHLNFPGNTILRTSNIYWNDTYVGRYVDPETDMLCPILEPSLYEGVRSFAIVTTRVTDSIVNYWAEQKSLYPSGPMKAAYGTFLTALLTEYCHDILADTASTEFNVTWSRTRPIVVSAGDETCQTYLTLECDHRMGMTVVGKYENMKWFNYACSSQISSIEYGIMRNLEFYHQSTTNTGTVDSVKQDMLKAFRNGKNLELSAHDGFIILKIENDDDLILVFDPKMGIMRDINTATNYCGAYCYSNLQTELAHDFFGDVKNNACNYRDWAQNSVHLKHEGMRWNWSNEAMLIVYAEGAYFSGLSIAYTWPIVLTPLGAIIVGGEVSVFSGSVIGFINNLNNSPWVPINES
jgi:parallel beta-helix repeat protein